MKKTLNPISINYKTIRRIGLTKCIVFLVFTSSISQTLPTDYVDLFMCTAGDHGQLDPSATVPFGMIKLGPDTNPGNHSGYDFNANEIKGFSHNRIGGVGCNGAGGNLRILPGIGDLDISSEGIIKESEKAKPSYYSITLKNNIKVELTATNQTGFHQYTYPKSDSAFVMVDIWSSFGGTLSASKKIINSHEFFVEVSAKNTCGLGRYTVYYHVWSNIDLSTMVDNEGKTYFKIKTQNREKVFFQVTASVVSAEDAREEWLSETKNLSFDDVKKEGLKKWENILSKITVEGKEEYKSMFYTHLYHQFLNPVKSENRLKSFRATNGEIYKSDGYTHYDCWSMWDNFRNKFSLYPLLMPETTADIANSLVDLYKYGMPFWSGFNEPVPTVRTEHTIITLLDFYRRGVTSFDIKPLYQKMLAELNNPVKQSPDQILENSYDFWAMAQFAKILDKPADYDLFMQEANKYKKVWKNKFAVMGKNADVMHGDGLYEGTLWQYRWHVQFDIDGMMEMMGGKEEFDKQLEYFFENNLYNHGNQPDIHAPYLFNFGGKPWLTQEWVNRILTKEMTQAYGTHKKWKIPYFGKVYKKSPEGYIPEMDDDEGTMSGWYVLASMGLYPVLVGDPVFQLSSPIFDKVTIHLANNKDFVIITKGLSDDSFYIQSATLNGMSYNQTAIKNDDILNGGNLTFKLGRTPNINFGK